MFNDFHDLETFRALHKRTSLDFDKHIGKNMKQENIPIKFCKFSLGVGKRTTNIAV
jgi:hypothetical protein